MNKLQFVEAIALETGMTKVEVKKLLDASLHVALKAFQRGDSLMLSGFGSFAVVQRSARMGRNPRTGNPVPIPSRRVVRFRPSVDFDD